MDRSVVAAIPVVAMIYACASTSAPPAAMPVADAGASEVDSGVESAPLVCPVVTQQTTPGKITSAEIDEASGIVQSSRNEGVYWIHNDSGDSARVFAVGATGGLLATVSFDPKMPADIEDIAIEDVSADESYLYVGDIGDNDSVRKVLTIHRIAEPKLDGTKTLTITSDKMQVTYPDGAHNAETLLFDPITKDLLIATKATGGPSYIHRIGPFVPGGSATTEKIAKLDIDLANGGEISRDGRYIGIRNYTEKALVWLRAPGESLADAFARKPCEVPVAKEEQGEAFAFLGGNTGFVTTSEGKSPPLHVNLFQTP